MRRLGSLKELYLTRLREFYRQPARIFWVYGFPTILALGLGIAFGNRPPAPIAVDLVMDREYGKPILQAVRDDPGLKLTQVTDAEATDRLRTGKAILVVIPSAHNTVTYRFDPTRPEATVARAVFDDSLQRRSGRKDVVAVRDERYEQPGSRYIDFLIPGLIGLNIMGGGLWGFGFFLVSFRIAKLLKRYMATPMPRENFLLALIGSRLTFLIPDVGVLLLMGMLVFGMPVEGNLGILALVVVVGALAFAGIGLLVASRAQTTETISGLMNLVMLPMWLLSGVFFDADRFPRWLQPAIQALPLTQLNIGLRKVILEGAGLDSGAVLFALATLAAWAVVTFAVALRIFRWT